MFKLRRVLARLILVLGDIGTKIGTVFLVQALLALLGVWSGRLGPLPDLGPSLYFELIPLLTVVAYFLSELYSLKGTSFWDDLYFLFRAELAISFLLVMVTVFPQGGNPAILIFVTVFWGVSCVAVPIIRYTLLTIIARSGLWNRTTIMVGTGGKAVRLAREISRDGYLGFEIIGFLEGPETATGSHSEAKLPSKDPGTLPFPVLGGISDLERLCDEREVNCAIVSLRDCDPQTVVKTVETVSCHVPDVRVMPDFPRVSVVGIDPEEMRGLPALTVRNNLLLSRNLFLKTLLDYSLVMLLSLLLFPVMGFLAFLILISSPGGILFGHKRLGVGKKEFTCWKFRTMVHNAEEILKTWLRENPEVRAAFEADFKLKEDPRITPVGRFLRRLSLDELPQIFNVLRGDMSLVGPRPIVLEEVAKYGEAQHLLFQVKPGITGLWQVSGRNDVSYDERVMLDIYYIRNWSPWLDIVILLKTLNAVLSKKGVY